jgi:hypothetical protein
MSDDENHSLIQFAARVADVASRVGIEVPEDISTLPRNSKSFCQMMDAFWADIGFEIIWEAREFSRRPGRPKLRQKQYLSDDPQAERKRRQRSRNARLKMMMSWFDDNR